jgi:hypothetical protein
MLWVLVASVKAERTIETIIGIEAGRLIGAVIGTSGVIALSSKLEIGSALYLFSLET